jgi:hypothetical protein
MKKFLLVALAGCVFCAGIVFIFLARDTRARDQPAQSSASSAVTLPAAYPIDVVPATPEPPKAAVVAVDAPTRIVLNSNAPTRPGPTHVRANGRETNASATPNLQPIPLTDAHLQVLHLEAADGSTLLREHANLEIQRRDETWANYMEQMLRGYFLGRGPQVGIELVNITCKTRTCEVQAFGSGTARVFNELLDDANKETWWEFAGTQVRSGTFQDRETIVAFLERAKKPTAP